MRVWICVDCKVSEGIQGKLQVLGNRRIPVGLVSIDFRVCKEDVDKRGQNSVSSRLMHCSAWSTIIGVHRPSVFIFQQWMSAPSGPTPTSSSLLHSKWPYTVSYLLDHLERSDCTASLGVWGLCVEFMGHPDASVRLWLLCLCCLVYLLISCEFSDLVSGR